MTLERDAVSPVQTCTFRTQVGGKAASTGRVCSQGEEAGVKAKVTGKSTPFDASMALTGEALAPRGKRSVSSAGSSSGPKQLYGHSTQLVVAVL